MNTIVVMARDEDNFIIDFIVHHISIGFDRIIIFDDLSKIPIENLLIQLPAAMSDKVECYRFDVDFYTWQSDGNYRLLDSQLYLLFPKSKQMYVYNYAISHLLSHQDWCAFIDVDEFIWLGQIKSIDVFRHQIQKAGFSAVIFDMLLYGHGFNSIPRKPNTIQDFIWCANRYYGHGKYFAHIGSLSGITDTHYPTAFNKDVVCDSSLSRRLTEFRSDISRNHDNKDVPHLKHYIIQDVYSCFARRARSRISSNDAVSHKNPSWVDRIAMLEWTSTRIDLDLAVCLLAERQSIGMDIELQVAALSHSINRISETNYLSADLDFSYLRSVMDIEITVDDAELLFIFFSKNPRDPNWLRFKRLPSDFDLKSYRLLNSDLGKLDDRGLIKHYVNHGQREGRIYKR